MTEALPEKKCFKCGEVKALSDFYKHPQMADGHVNKCKECNKKDVLEHRELNLEKIQDYDRERRKKCNVSDERWKELSDYQNTYLKAYREDNPKKYAAHSAVSNAVRDGHLIRMPCVVCGDSKVHAHHMDYN